EESVANDPVGHRPDRVEPRARTRRPKQYPLLMEPRKEARAALLKASQVYRTCHSELTPISPASVDSPNIHHSVVGISHFTNNHLVAPQFSRFYLIVSLVGDGAPALVIELP